MNAPRQVLSASLIGTAVEFFDFYIDATAAVLLATENAPLGLRAGYGMFPQLGAPVGYFCSGVIVAHHERVQVPMFLTRASRASCTHASMPGAGDAAQ